MSLKSICMEMGISPEVYDYCAAKEGELSERFREIDEIFEYNQIIL